MKMSCSEESFRLNDAVSVCSMRSKAMIDALFEDTRSVCSSTYSGWYASARGCSINHEDTSTDGIKRANCAVQARIEAMFASVEAETGKAGECAAAVLPVKYLGAAPVGGRVASIRGLQEPLRQLLERLDTAMSAELEISRRGLTFRTSESFEKTNPFRRIAVWSALKLRSRSKTPQNLSETHHAFLPLVSDDPSPQSDDKYSDLYRSMRGLESNVGKYPPVFAVIMRRPGAARVLECHAFACKTEEDAVAAAATLYRALLADLDSNRRRPRQSNGLGCASLASVASSYMDHNSVFSKMDHTNIPPRPSPSHPIRPPRTKKTSTSGSTTDGSSSVIKNKIPRRKKLSEIRPEDILEARKRRTLAEDSRSVLQELKDDRSVASAAGTNRSSKGRTSRSRNEEINNMRNKLYSGDNSVMKSNDENVIYVGKMNSYERTPRKPKTFVSERNYSFVEKNGSIVGEVVVTTEAQLYDKNVKQGSFDLGKSSSIFSGGSPQGNDNESKSCENSIYERPIERKRSSREKSYEEHFRDADKIFSIGQEEIQSSKKKHQGRAQTPQNKINMCKNSNNKDERGNARVRDGMQSVGSRYENNIPQNDRSSRIDEFSRGSCDDKMKGTCGHGRERKKRNRAGSEPPLSRTEDASKKLEIKLKRSQSDLEERGDLMTRVELPRRGSFLKPGAPRLPNNVNGGTPLGFTELFDEFRNQEGLTSVDDILATIIDPEGMSFNELKPLYKEFLLKLASTLTQDELYQRSANIMKRRRRPSRRRSMRKPCLLGRAIKRSVSKIKSGPTEFTSVIFPARKFNENFDSSSSCEARNSRRVLASRLSRRRSSWKRTKGLTTSEDSDTGRRMGRSTGAGANRSSSGYVSCSECSYDSESCTCISADKCYCSLPRRSPPQGSSNNAIVCGCDTDSCSESNKCYCARHTIQPSIMEQLRQRGIVPSEGTLSRGRSPERNKVSRSSKGQTSSRSLEYTNIRPSPGRSSSDNLALDYELFSPGKKSQCSAGSEKVLVVSARDPQGRLVYVGGAERKKKSSSSGAHRAGAHHEALSIKKSAEIAAVFGDSAARGCRRAGSFSSMRSSISLEAGLGYLP
ncbi:uncharacterized protein LOC107038473 [Diachasma alloeum]|uniref:uncharacterized protein LOC107038473 n=1 Tax=Diachasma alloeum TaxID=454923 RepID=UPI0007382D3F|nr:uncharacterized protein LOC107038473 [Diachasma alloeum]